MTYNSLFLNTSPYLRFNYVNSDDFFLEGDTTFLYNLDNEN